ncbi:unnamed protein product [Brassicogethes aeneus]|uniref:Uncharacterized protein n=1 Tax=Brassicogethes aeneus TaxID=1431903 RepID=A0A9P0FNR3_BRAAE|nr:unnamed protein product [Brassicogethes aeneus]
MNLILKVKLKLLLFLWLLSGLITLFLEELLLNKSEATKIEKSLSLDHEKDLVTAKEIKIALSKETDSKKILPLLTTVTIDWNAAKIEKMLGVTNYMAKTALKIRKSSGFGAAPSTKIGRALSNSTIEKIRSFYESDEYSRIMPGKKDCISIMIEGKKESVQKRLLLSNIKDLHGKFLERYPDTKVSLSKFTKLRPANCVVVGCSGSHNVGVCKIHQNIKLKIHALNLALKESDQTYTINDLTKNMMCPDQEESCNLLICDECPGFSPLSKNLADRFKAKNIVERMDFFL